MAPTGKHSGDKCFPVGLVGPQMFPRRCQTRMFPRRADEATGKHFHYVSPSPRRWQSGRRGNIFLRSSPSGADGETFLCGAFHSDGETFPSGNPKLSECFPVGAGPTGKHSIMFPRRSDGKCFPVALAGKCFPVGVAEATGKHFWTAPTGKHLQAASTGKHFGMFPRRCDSAQCFPVGAAGSHTEHS